MTGRAELKVVPTRPPSFTVESGEEANADLSPRRINKHRDASHPAGPGPCPAGVSGTCDERQAEEPRSCGSSDRRMEGLTKDVLGA